jgi:hypothetical protein
MVLWDVPLVALVLVPVGLPVKVRVVLEEVVAVMLLVAVPVVAVVVFDVSVMDVCVKVWVWV